YGINAPSMNAMEAAQYIRARGIRAELTVALDIWAKVRRALRKGQDPRRTWLVAVACAADPDEWRNQVREAPENGQRQNLTNLAASPRLSNQSAQTMYLLGDGLDLAHWETVLRLAQRMYPDDF